MGKLDWSKQGNLQGSRLTHSQMVGLIGKAKRMKREGMFGDAKWLSSGSQKSRHQARLPVVSNSCGEMAG